jgi:hypothetical protein
MLQLAVDSGTYWRKKEYALVAQHKSGTQMCGQAKRGWGQVQTETDENVNMFSGDSESKVPYFTSPWNTMGFAINDKMMMTPRQHCILHVMRNPFEMLVSGYLYHKAGAEEWTSSRFGTAMANSQPPKPRFYKGRMSMWTDDDVNSPDYVKDARDFAEHKPLSKVYGYWGHLFLHGMAKVMNASSAPPLNQIMPEASANESYSQYLQRAGIDAGLIANAIWANITSLGSMKFVHDYAESQQCSLSICLHDFYKDCEATWRRIVTTWEIPERYHGLLVAGANESCPLVSEETKKHSSAEWSKKEKITHPPLHALIARLRELDKSLFNGTIAQLEASQSCPVSEHYMTN